MSEGTPTQAASLTQEEPNIGPSAGAPSTIPQHRVSTSTTRTVQSTRAQPIEETPSLLKEQEIQYEDISGLPMPAPAQPMLHTTLSSQAGSVEALLSLPPPPAYDVHVRELSIAVPPFRAYIPTPIPIPIPTALTNTLTKKRKNADGSAEHGDGLIVRDVNAAVRSGEMLAIVGGSGSGKTTLLHAIASRLGNLPIAHGSVTMTPSAAGVKGGGEGRFKGMRNILGFVRQNDYLLPNLTVRETLTYSAKLRLPSSIDKHTRSLIVEQTIQELGLNDAADTLVGGSGRKGISGGERRRLSIGCVLVSFPSVLVLDEVTTGLDAFTAYQLLETLARLARKGRTIVLSLHQPRSDAFPLFSRLLVLSRGSVVYSGAADRCLGHFAKLGHTPAEQTNPLDFIVDISSVDTRDEDSERESQQLLDSLVRAWRNYEADSLDNVEHGHRAVPLDGEKTDGASNEPPITMGGKRPGILQQTLILVPRSVKNTVRAYPELVGHFTQAFMIGLLMGIVFYQLKGRPQDIQSLKTLAFQVLPVYSYMSQVVWTYKWCTTLIVFDREREDSLYNPSAWLFAEWLAWLPVNLVAPALYAVMVYFISNLRMDNLGLNFGVFIASTSLVHLCFVAWALLAASIERSFARASLLGNALSIFFILSPGFFIINVPGWIRWFRWISPYFYAFRAITITQFRGREFECEGVTGPPRAQCVGDNVLNGLRISSTQPLYPLFLGLIGFIIGVLALCLLLLTAWKPGGVQHARRVQSETKGKELAAAEIDLARTRIEVRAEDVRLTYVRRTLPRFDAVRTPILAGVSASFPPGEVSAIMGPSGSGKSTLLRLLSGRTTPSGVMGSFEPQGRVTFNGEPVSMRTRHLCAFVEQDDDYHLPALTVRETLRYAAVLTLPRTVSKKRKLARAEEVLRMLGLRDCADGVVGGELLKGISGGEKRRLSLACQMINDPAVLIVDEPTSGLDANTARNVMEALRDIARSGRTVIVSVHQPRSDIYNMCDNILLLAKRGNVVFQGPRNELLPHLALAGYICPPLYNPSDYCMDLISVDVRRQSKQRETSARIDSLVHHWQNCARKLADVTAEKDGVSKDPVPLEERQEQTPIWIALPVVLDRSLRNTWRLQDVFWTRLIQAPILAICFFIFFLRLKKGPSGAQDRIGLVAESTSSIPFVGFLNLAALYPMEKTIFFHDRTSAGAKYSSATFITAFSIFAIVPELISAMLYALIMNVATGMQTNARIFFEFSIAIWAQLSFGESVGIAFASFFDTMGLSVSLVSVFLTVASMSSGIFSASISPFLEGLAWIFPMKYAARVMLTNEMKGLRFNCSPESIQSGECIAADGQQVLDLFRFHQETWWLILAMVAITVAYRVAAWAILAARVRHI